MTTRHPLRILLAKPGLDGHDRGLQVVAKSLREPGMDVIYLGPRSTPDEIAGAAVEEDVDAVGVSNLSGAYGTLLPAIARALETRGVDLRDMVLFGGGTIPAEDHASLREVGYRAIFGPGTRLEDIAEFLREEVPR